MDNSFWIWALIVLMKVVGRPAIPARVAEITWPQGAVPQGFTFFIGLSSLLGTWGSPFGEWRRRVEFCPYLARILIFSRFPRWNALNRFVKLFIFLHNLSCKKAFIALHFFLRPMSSKCHTDSLSKIWIYCFFKNNCFVI